MRMRVVIPTIETNLPRAAVERWHVQPGERVAFGNPICDLAVSERVKTTSVRRADALIRVTRKQKKVKAETEVEADRFHVVYQVLASEAATIVRHVADLGESLAVGDLLAIADSEDSPDLAPTDSEETAPTMRVVAALAPEEAF